MKQCPACRRNVLESVTSCPFCKRPIGPGAMPGQSGPAARPVRPGDLPSLAGVPEDEPHTLNWFVLLRRCLQASGRFSRSQFAVVYVGTLAAFWLLVLAVVFGAQAVGASEDAASTIAGLLLLAMVPVLLVATLGGSIRRWHDLDHSGWMVLLQIVPCVGLIAVLYLLFAPGTAVGRAPAGNTPVIAIVAAVLVCGVFGIGMIAAIAIPSLLRARVSANESAAIGDIRAVVSAQEAYRSANGGFYEGNLECLAAPAVGCLPGYPAGGPTFLDPALAARQPKSGYERRFEPGRRVEVDPAVSSPTSVDAYAYVAVPLRAGQTGVRSFCGDSSGVVCFNASGGAIRVLGGACPGAAEGCTPIS